MTQVEPRLSPAPVAPRPEVVSTREAREALVRAWWLRLHGLALAVSGRAQEAEDLVQEAFARALRSPRLPRDPAAQGAWLSTILRNVFTDRLRRLRTERALVPPGRRPAAPAPTDPVERAEASLARLPEEERLVCWLRLVAEVPFREIALLLSTSKSAVDRTFRRALARLREEETA